MKQDVLEKLGEWWDGKSKKPLINISILNDRNFINQNELWQDENQLPDFEKIVNAQIENTKKFEYLGVSYPVLPHQWASRGTPMVMCAYLGSRVIFREQTVWFEKFIDDWWKTKIEFNERNFWVQASKKLMETQAKMIDDERIFCMPDFGDALTCFSMMRGVENLMIDIVETPEIIIEKIDEFVSAWVKAHSFFYDIFQKKLSGDASWLLWAPGKTYACQSDFSTMISPKMFEKFVVYELEKIKDYLEYIAWHLDGPDEIKHLDTLISLPYIKVIQITPGAGKPGCASSLWLPQIKKIIEKKKQVILYCGNKEEFDILIKNFPSGRALVCCGTVDFENKSDREFFKYVENFL